MGPKRFGGGGIYAPGGIYRLPSLEQELHYPPATRSYPSMSVTAYTAAYVRELAANRRLRARVSACLANGLAWEQEERLVVCMIDISGYSKLSAGLTVLGKMESEIITKTVGGYLNKIIDVIEVYSGDIVRFLGGYFTLVTASVESHDRVGDALLVTFTPVNDEFLGEAVLRSLKCCLHVATCCKSVDVDMSLASTSTATTSGDYTSTKVAGPSASLHLHFAITAGNMSRVIIGDPAWRLDYCIQGSGLRSLGVLLDNTGKGELGISSDAVEELPDKWRGAVESMKAGIVAGHSLLNAIAVASLAGICCNVGATALADMSVGQASSLFKAAYAAVCTRRGSDVGFDEDETDDDFVRLFVNHSSLRRFDGLTGIRRATVISNGLQGSQADVVVGRRASVIAKGAQGAQADVSAGRRASVSFIRRGSVMSYSQDAGNPATAAEFRNVATIFVSLMFPFEKDLVQTIMLSFLKALKEHKGVFVQYSADDKGQTMLAVFGLPSFSHVNNSDQSIKCVKFFIEDIKRTLGGSLFAKHLAIAIASGEILLTKLGNDYRSEIGLLGDVIVAAARLMSIAQKKEAVIIDEETNHKIKLTHPTADLGLVHLKGRTGDTQVYGLQLEGIEARGPGAGLGRFGYRHEREVIGERFSAWISDRRRTLVVIEAASGLGKSMLGNFLTGLATDHGIPVCLTQGSEIEQWRPFSGLQPILMFVLNNIPSTPRHPGAVSAVTMMKNSTSKIIRSQSFSTYSGRHSDTGLSLNGAPGSGLAGHVIPFLEKAGIDIRLMPLLGMISPSLAATETALTRSMDPLAKINHVKSMVAKIVTTFVLDFAAIFIFDDAQWFDSHTLEVLMTLSRHCPKSRPLELSENRILDQTLALADTAHLILKGFTEQEATEMIMSKLSKLTVRVKGIDSNISTAILAKTAGSPLFLQMIIDVIFVKIGGELVVNDDGVVVLRDDSVRIETILTDLGAAVLFQFDRLDEVFQRLLKTASVFGQYFNLRNVLDLGDFDMDEMECIDMIKERDTYNFLSYDLPTPASSQELDTESRSSSDGVQCSFRHISILNAIYESLSFEERIAMNLSVGLMVEGLLNEGNRENLLPSLEYHFARTQEVEKVIKYKEELGSIAKNRGDSASEHLAMVFVGGNSFSLGDFDYIDDTTVTFFKTSPTMKDDPIFSFTMAALIYKVALMRGDAQAMAEWREVFEPRERVASMLNFGLGMKEVLEAWVAAIKADVSTALDLLEKCDKIMPRRDMAAQDMAVMQALPFVFILIVDPMRSGVSTNSHTSKWQGAELKRLKDVVASATAYTRYLGTVMHHCFSYWTMPLMESIGQILHGHERRAVHIASKTIKCIRRKELDEQKLVKAIYCGIIAKYSSSETERSRSKSFARDEFSRVKSPLYLNWLDA
ncbi:hypothetical protein HK101_005536 [Irineochytrium annulatum]|nr:hypothetical protein HK101_005536 [Irineochytrium annulatum]